ncbi:SURF1 family protein [Mycoavidus sp. HKI]|uniref:SURF1 family protein n=1 Tax=Mycoavidus sp. HKI TaxID=2840467 RepID=UPI001CBF3391|nr:SURF1 family protein [Mycoavidus sp. HKI]UAW64000.2 SURF1 family protein [Mycoavidus sp. HKI]
MLKIRFWPALVVLIAVVLAIRLGFWQRDRAHQKEALAAQITRHQHSAPISVGSSLLPLKEIEYHRLRARGRFMPEHVVYLDNRPYNDQPGFHVLMPLALEEGGYVLVKRGWIPRNIKDRIAFAPYCTPASIVDIEGIARADAGRAFELGSGGSAARLRIRQNLEIAAYQAETGLPLQPFILWQTNHLNDQLVRVWPSPLTGVARNYGYMVQWWGIAVAIVLSGLYAARRAALSASK